MHGFVLSLLSNCYLIPRANILCLSVSSYKSHVFSQYSLIFYRVKNEKYCLPRGLGSRLCDRWPILLCAHQCEFFFGHFFPIRFIFCCKIIGKMRHARGQWLDHRVVQLCARRLQGELRQPPQDHCGRLHRQHELPPHGEVLNKQDGVFRHRLCDEVWASESERTKTELRWSL